MFGCAPIVIQRWLIFPDANLIVPCQESKLTLPGFDSAIRSASEASSKDKNVLGPCKKITLNTQRQKIKIGQGAGGPSHHTNCR